EGAIVNDVTQDPRFYKKIDEKSGFKTRSILCVPMSTKNRTLGAIEVINKLDSSDFNELDLTFCGAIAGQAAIAIENALLHKQIIQTERLAAIGQTVAGLAHCIKNVLYGIQGGSYMVDLGLRKNNGTTLLKGWEIVKKNSSFMHNLVLDMLTYSKDRKPEYESADIYEIIDTVCDLVEAKTYGTGIIIRQAPKTFDGDVVLDSSGIRRCLLNLVSNAADACAGIDNGLIGITADVVNGSILRIVISDNGSGISEEDRSSLFQIFFSTKGSKGTGLGLAVTHKIISEHEGTIEVESELGKGTKFIIDLPLRKETN
ncbi:ATP-binding protein, partial [Candidatus Latescibacterota bacterium]